MEQVLIERYGIGRKGGSLLNKYNSIAHDNPICRGAIERGKYILDAIGFEF